MGELHLTNPLTRCASLKGLVLQNNNGCASCLGNNDVYLRSSLIHFINTFMDMNYNWTEGVRRGQDYTGFLDVYLLNDKGRRAVSLVDYHAQFRDKQNANINVTLLIQKNEAFWTSGDIKRVFYDMEEYIKRDGASRFISMDAVKVMQTKVLYIDNLDGIEYVSNGDFALFQGK